VWRALSFGWAAHLFRGVHSAIHAGVAALSYWVLQHLEQLQAYIADYKNYALPVMLGGLALLFRMSDALSKIILEKVPLFSRALRHLLSGEDFIEGDWPLAVIDMQTQKPLYLGFLRIGYRNGQHYVTGDDWRPDGSHALAFRSMQSLYRDHTLQYWYEQGASLHRPDMRGYTEIFFFPNGALAERHAGKFLDPNHTTDIRFYARKQRYRLLARRFRSPEKRLEAARGFLAELEPALPRLKNREISADFV
jgi:hypothetical protein